MAYRKDRWTASFEGQLSVLRPHLTPRVRTTMRLAAWPQFGTREADPIRAVRDGSKSLAKPKPSPKPASPRGP